MRSEKGTFYELRSDDVAWRSSDNRIFLIDEMTLPHLINTINFIKQKNKEKKSEPYYIIPDRMIERLDEMKDLFPEYFI